MVRPPPPRAPISLRAALGFVLMVNSQNSLVMPGVLDIYLSSQPTAYQDERRPIVSVRKWTNGVFGTRPALERETAARHRRGRSFKLGTGFRQPASEPAVAGQGRIEVPRPEFERSNILFDHQVV